MPLSEEELRLLEQMERALVEEDPKFASTLRGTSLRSVARRRAIIAGVVFVDRRRGHDDRRWSLQLIPRRDRRLRGDAGLGHVALSALRGQRSAATATADAPAPTHPSRGFTVIQGGRQPTRRRRRSRRPPAPSWSAWRSAGVVAARDRRLLSRPRTARTAADRPRRDLDRGSSRGVRRPLRAPRRARPARYAQPTWSRTPPRRAARARVTRQHPARAAPSTDAATSAPGAGHRSVRLRLERWPRRPVVGTHPPARAPAGGRSAAARGQHQPVERLDRLGSATGAARGARRCRASTGAPRKLRPAARGSPAVTARRATEAEVERRWRAARPTPPRAPPAAALHAAARRTSRGASAGEHDQQQRHDRRATSSQREAARPSARPRRRPASWARRAASRSGGRSRWAARRSVPDPTASPSVSDGDVRARVYDGTPARPVCRRGLEPDPAGAGEVQLGPGVQVVGAVDSQCRRRARSGARKPTATRAGMPSDRAITAIADANCSQ